MKLKTKNIIAFISWIITGFVIIAIAIEKDNVYYGIMVPVLALIFGVYIRSLKCPNCSNPVVENSVRIFGKELNRVTVWVPRRCSKCGHDLENV